MMFVFPHEKPMYILCTSAPPPPPPPLSHESIIIWSCKRIYMYVISACIRPLIGQRTHTTCVPTDITPTLYLYSKYESAFGVTLSLALGVFKVVYKQQSSDGMNHEHVIFNWRCNTVYYIICTYIYIYENSPNVFPYSWCSYR